MAARVRRANCVIHVQVRVGGDDDGRRLDVARELLRRGVGRGNRLRAGLRGIRNLDGGHARPSASGERLEERCGEADAYDLSARRDPVHAQHGAAAEETAAADRALPAHDGVDVVMSDVPVGANAGRKQSRRGHRANARVLDAGNGAVSLEGAADDAE